MNTIIKSKTEMIVDYAKNTLNISLEDDFAFSLFLLQFFYYDGKPINECWNDVYDCVVDGANDGGIDFVYYDDENDKIVLGQVDIPVR